MTLRLTVVLLFCLASIANATVYTQIAFYPTSTCSGTPFTYSVTSEIPSCTAAGCTAEEGGGYMITSCPSSLYSGIPAGKYLYQYQYSSANCSASATILSVAAIPADYCFQAPGEPGSAKYSCDSGAPQQIQYSDTSCSTVETTTQLAGCSNAGPQSTNFSCSDAHSMASSFSLVAGTIFAVVLVFMTQ